ncbi:MAG TPA: class I SAM-dependent methyltransferase [Blastocatellia bacterium]|nr:class I SAM-dependent methyltransferase [Blastocatellia bacterium]
MNNKELAYLYDLYLVPGWREAFDCIVDDEIELPREGKILDAGCGTGGYAIDLAIRCGPKVEVVGVDPNPERIALAWGKVEVKKVDRVSFRVGSLTDLGSAADEFDLVIADASMLPAAQIGAFWTELARVTRRGGTVALKLTTRGSFDEFFSIYWEALYHLQLTGYTPQLEGLITERLTVTEAEQLAAAARFGQIRSVTRKERFDFADAQAFFEAPLIETVFLEDWFSILPDQESRARVKEQLARIIDEERQGAELDGPPRDAADKVDGEAGANHDALDFDVSIKATLVIARKP